MVVERAVKYARRKGYKLRVYVERSDKTTDRLLMSYYRELRSQGVPFDSATSAKYCPLGAADFKDTLYEFRLKTKAAPLIQLADLCLWPLCIGGYDAANVAYAQMVSAGSLLDSKLTPHEAEREGIKYSCFELRRPQTQKPS
jgi:hypothetical protein